MIQEFCSLKIQPYKKGSADAPTASLHESVFHVMQEIHRDLEMENITVLKILPHDLPSIPVAQIDLETILLHLIRNACQSLGAAGGMVTLEASRENLPHTEDSASARFCLRVTDNGPGISAIYLPLIFEPFFSTKPASSGNGLGLYTVKKIVARYGGGIRVETSSAETSFFIEFPG